MDEVVQTDLELGFGKELKDRLPSWPITLGLILKK